MTATSGTPVTALTTPWYLAAGATTGRLTQELAGLQGNLVLTGAHRFAAVTTDEPTPWVNLGTTLAVNDERVDDIVLSSTTNAMWVQFRTGSSVSAGAGGDGFATLQAAVDGTGALLAEATFQIPPVLNAATVGYWDLGVPFPLAGLTKLMFAYVVSGVAASITVGGALRAFKGDLTKPSAYTDVASTTYTTSANGKSNPGSQVIPVIAGGRTSSGRRR